MSDAPVDHGPDWADPLGEPDAPVDDAAAPDPATARIAADSGAWEAATRRRQQRVEAEGADSDGDASLLAWACRQPPERERVELLLRAAAATGLASLTSELGALDASLRGDAGATPFAARRLLAVLDAASQASPEGLLRHNFCALWGVAPMRPEVGRHSEWFAPAELVVEGVPGPITAVLRPGARLAVPEGRLVLRPARVRTEGVVPSPDAGDDDAGGPLLEQLAAFFNSGVAPREATRELKQALQALAEGDPVDEDGWTALADAITGWRAAVRGAEQEPPAALDAGLQHEVERAVDALQQQGLEVLPWPPVAGQAFPLLEARHGAGALHARERWSATVDAGCVLWVERLGLRRGGELLRPARLWLGRGEAPPRVVAGQRALAQLEACGVDVDPLRARLDELGADAADERIRGLLGMVNGLDQHREGSQAEAVDEAIAAMLSYLADAGVREEPIRVGDAFDRLDPELFHLRKAPSPGAQEGEVVAVRRRAFRGGDGRVVQQAMIDVNLP